jgi:hypothetical protein
VPEFDPISEREIETRNRWLSQELIRLPPDFKDWLIRHIENENPRLDTEMTSGGASTYAASNVTTDRTYDANATSLNELADVLGSLIQDLRAKGIVG